MKPLAIALPAALVALSLPAAHGVVLLTDNFDGTTLNTAVWTLGSTGSLGTATVGSGNLVLNVNQTTNSARTAVVTDATNFNPFASPITVSLDGLALGGNPGSSFNTLYSAIGRLSTDTGGDATGALAASFSAGGSYGTGGAFGVSLLGFTSSYRIQILDSGSNVAAKQVQIALSGAPTGMSYTVDGANATWTLSVTGTTFTGAFLANALNATQVNSTTITGSLLNFTASSLAVGEGSVGRLVLGANNGSGVTTGSIATFGSVTASDATVIPEPSSFALLASAFAGGLALTRRRRR